MRRECVVFGECKTRRESKQSLGKFNTAEVENSVGSIPDLNPIFNLTSIILQSDLIVRHRLRNLKTTHACVATRKRERVKLRHVCFVSLLRRQTWHVLLRTAEILPFKVKLEFGPSRQRGF